MGRIISHYEIVEKIGEGGMGVVYKARDTELGRFVVLKFLPPTSLHDSDRRLRLTSEARTASALNHPNIVTIYEIGEAGGENFIAMEYIDGAPLSTVLQNGPLSVDRAIRYGMEIAQALHAAHQNGIVHRDIKPANILITRGDRIKVLDFGLAKLTEESLPLNAESETRTAALTQPGMVMGTPAYMSPEQAEGKPADARSDLFSLGVVLFEMLTAQRPFKGESKISTLLSILRDPPPNLAALRPGISGTLECIVRRTLEKKPTDRYQSASDLERDLAGLPLKTASRHRWLIAGIALLVIFGSGSWGLWRVSRVRWARNTGLVQARRLTDQGKLTAAYDLAEQVEKIIPADDPELKKLWNDVARNVELDSVPSGAKVWRKDFMEPGSAFRYLGVTPLHKFRTVRGYHHLKFEKDEFAVSNDVAMANALEMKYILAPKVNVPAEMVLVPQAPPQLTQTLSDLPTLDLTDVDAFLIDRYEVTNRQFKAFVDSSGYSNRHYWKEPFTLEGQSVSFEQAMARFSDSTGRPGPASWVGGTFAEGADDFPVSGVSWYEAAAYAAFAGKSLPSLYQWYRVADPRISVIIGPVSNIGGKRVAKVGQFPNGEPFGAFDVFGNVKEWVFNHAGNESHFILGGAANEFAYQATAVDARSPWDRHLNHGFRCVRYLKPPRAQHLNSVVPQGRDLSREKPVSDEVFAALKRFYTCERGGLNASTDARDDTNEDWRTEKISFQACYGEERVLAHLYLPKSVPPPYQVVVYQPGADANTQPSSESASGFGRVDFIIRSGRAVFWPVVKGHYERRYANRPKSVTEFRERAFKPFQDLLRSVEYLQTRSDIVTDRMAYAGTSQGANRGVIVVALEPRFRAVVFMDGGLFRVTPSPELDALNFAPRVKIPALMVNGRYDFTFPVETSQNPLFRLLGVPESEKRHVLFDSAHDVILFRTNLIREVLSWLDSYLGPVNR